MFDVAVSDCICNARRALRRCLHIASNINGQQGVSQIGQIGIPHHLRAGNERANVPTNDFITRRAIRATIGWT